MVKFMLQRQRMLGPGQDAYLSSVTVRRKSSSDVAPWTTSSSDASQLALRSDNLISILCRRSRQQLAGTAFRSRPL